ncbi:hypothetical protein CRENBAI_009962, partial [Crenichthys baileyi]
KTGLDDGFKADSRFSLFPVSGYPGQNLLVVRSTGPSRLTFTPALTGAKRLRPTPEKSHTP